MKMIIDIDDEDYKRIQDVPDVFDSLTSRTYSAIANGTPIPKPHGKIIDKFNVAIGKINGSIVRLRKVREYSQPGVVILIDAKIQTYNHCIDILNELKEG